VGLPGQLCHLVVQLFFHELVQRVCGLSGALRRILYVRFGHLQVLDV
jgi:hypothetical protein